MTPVAGREAPRPSPHAKRGTLQRLSTTRRLQVKSYVEGAYGDKIRTSDMVNFNESSRAHWTAVVVHAMDNPEVRRARCLDSSYLDDPSSAGESIYLNAIELQ